MQAYRIITIYGLVKKSVYLLDNIFIRFGTKLYRQTICIPRELIALLLLQICFFFCYERDFMVSLT